MMLTPSCLTTQSKECPWADYALLFEPFYYKTPHHPLQVGTHSSEGICPLWFPLPGKAIKNCSFPLWPKPCLQDLIWYSSLCWCVCSHSVMATSLWPWLTNPSVLGVFSARLVEQVAISYSRGSSWPRDQIHISCVSCIAGRFSTTESPWKPLVHGYRGQISGYTTSLNSHHLLIRGWPVIFQVVSHLHLKYCKCLVQHY